MVKRRPKSRPVRVSGVPNTSRVSSASESTNDEIFAAPQIDPGFLKVCRLCETKDGPFLNIFDADKVTAKRIDEVLPFTVSEKDELPNKICFRCSAKVEELYEFILKCIKTQESLQTTIGKKTPLVTKSRFRVQWESQLNKKNISNDDICNALIKKAMEGIKDNIPLHPLPVEEENRPLVNRKVKNSIEPPVTLKNDKEPAAVSNTFLTNKIEDHSENDDVKLKQLKLALEKCDEKVPLTRASRSNKSEPLADGLVENTKRVKHYSSRKSHSKVDLSPVVQPTNTNAKPIDRTKNNDQNGTTVISNDKPVPAEIEKPKEVKVPEPPPINIMDHVSIIKVNKVGTLFLCKLCNRNFLKKELVLTHGCAKNNVPKDKFLHSQAPPREIPKPSTVKYIKMDKDFKLSVPSPVVYTPTPPVMAENKPVEKNLPTNPVKVNYPVQPEAKPKPKIGPASKVKKLQQPPEVPKEPAQPPAKPVQENTVISEVKFPAMPSLNSRYKLVPGPNNTFTLVEDGVTKIDIPPQAPSNVPKPKRKRNEMVEEEATNLYKSDDSNSEVIDLDDIPSQPSVIPNQQPYPVGLFQTAHHSGGFGPAMPKPPFTTPAMKKQSYTIVRTGNPNKLLISTKPQPAEEPQRKKSKKSKPETESLEDNSKAKDAGFFTFINVDPLLQPSYVLPTDNIIQESQISTSTSITKPAAVEAKDKDRYSCNMCDETFSREKKLLSHIQSHFNQMDEEDQLRREKSVAPKKKTTRKT